MAASAFFWSPSFQFQRRGYQEFPADTIGSYWAEYAAAIKDPACVVLVAEDILEPDEANHVYEALRSVLWSEAPRRRGIVGVCTLNLKPESRYSGHFQPASKNVSAAKTAPGKASEDSAGHNRPCDQPEMRNRKRDQCDEAVEIYKSTTDPLKLKYVKHSVLRAES